MGIAGSVVGEVGSRSGRTIRSRRAVDAVRKVSSGHCEEREVKKWLSMEAPVKDASREDKARRRDGDSSARRTQYTASRKKEWQKLRTLS